MDLKRLVPVGLASISIYLAYGGLRDGYVHTGKKGNAHLVTAAAHPFEYRFFICALVVGGFYCLYLATKKE